MARPNPLDPDFPGIPRPGTFRPQGLNTLSTACSPPGLALGPSTKAAPMGFALQGLTPPDRRYPSQGLASLVVSPPPLSQGRARLQRSTPTGKGNESRYPKITTVEPCPPGCLAPSGLSPSPPWDRLPDPSPSCPFDRKCSLRFHFRAGLQGIVSNESGLPLSRLPALLGFRTFPYTRASLDPLHPWLMVSPRPEGLFGASDDPTGVQRADASVHSIHLTPDSDCFSMSNVRVRTGAPNDGG